MQKIAVWIVFVILLALFGFFFVPNVMHRVVPNPDWYEAIGAAQQLRFLEIGAAFVLFCFVYYWLCKIRQFEELTRLIMTFSVTLLMATTLFSWLMSNKFHAFRPEDPAPFDLFVTSLLSPLWGIALVVFPGIVLNILRIRKVGLHLKKTV
jgi:hypothetical protein